MNRSPCPWPAALLPAALLVALVVAGCATYRAAPLGDAAPKTTRLPDTAAVRVAAAKLDHPLLRPLRLDFSDGLSPEEAALVAVAANPTLRAARTRHGVASAQLLTAGLLPNPQLSAGAAFPLNAPPGEVTELSTGLSFDLRALFTRGVEKKGARATLRSVDLGVAWQEWQVAQQARLQAYRAVFLRRQVALARAQENALEAGLDVLRRAAAQRLATVVDRAAAASAYRMARATRLDLTLQRDSTRQGLYRVLGLPAEANDTLRLQRGVVAPGAALDVPSAPLPASDTLAAPISAPDTTSPTFPELPSQRALLDSLTHRRLDLAALRLGYRSQEQSVRAAVLRQFPSINVGVNGTRDTGGFLTLGPAVSVGLPFFGRSQGQIAVARTTRAKLRAEYAARLHDARAQVAQLRGQIRDVRRLLRNAVVATRVQQDLVVRYGQALRLGDADVLTYYDARITLIDDKLKALKLRQQLVELGIALEIASGHYLPSLLATSPSE